MHVLRIERQRRPRFHVGAGREFERRRHHADDGVGNGVELDGLPDDRRIPRQHARPEAVAEHDDAILADDGFVRGERPPQRRLALEDVEQIGRRLHRRHVLRIAGALVGVVDVPVRGERFKALRLALPVFEGGNGDGPLIAVRIDLPQDRDLLGRFVRERIEDDGLDDAEDRGIRANAERQRQRSRRSVKVGCRRSVRKAYLKAAVQSVMKRIVSLT